MGTGLVAGCMEVECNCDECTCAVDVADDGGVSGSSEVAADAEMSTMERDGTVSDGTALWNEHTVTSCTCTVAMLYLLTAVWFAIKCKCWCKSWCCLYPCRRRCRCRRPVDVRSHSLVPCELCRKVGGAMPRHNLETEVGNYLLGYKQTGA